MCTARRCHTCMSRMLPGAPFHVGRVALATTLEAGAAHCAASLVPASGEVGHASFSTLRACDHVLVNARARSDSPDDFDVLVVGAGPSGAAASYWLAARGHSVLAIEKKHFPREKTCGDGLTPRAVRQLHDMGLADRLAGFQRFDGLRSIAHGVTLELAWPEHPDFPSYGYVVRRRELDEMVAEQAVKAGATHLAGRRGGRARSSTAVCSPARWCATRTRTRSDPVRARYVVVADGANSRFGRALGTARDRSFPLGMAIRGYFTSPLHDEPWIESHLDIRDRDGNHLPGYGWIFPVGDGTVNVGVGLLSTFQGWKHVNTIAPDGGVLRDRARPLGPVARDRDRRPHRRAPPDRRVGDPAGRPDLRGRRRRGRVREPLQRRGHLGRVRDRPARRRRRRSRARPPATAWRCRPTTPASTRSTASTSRWRGCSCGPSATRR